MPISVPGPARPNWPNAARGSQAGFSLLEVLVVLAIIGIVTGTVGLGVGAARDARKLNDDAQRLAYLFPLAQAHARKTGAPVVWQYDSSGYRFVQASGSPRLPVALSSHPNLNSHVLGASGPLRPREWSPDRPVEVRASPASTVVFRDEWVSGPRQLELNDGLHTVHLHRAGDGQYRVVP